MACPETGLAPQAMSSTSFLVGWLVSERNVFLSNTLKGLRSWFLASGRSGPKELPRPLPQAPTCVAVKPYCVGRGNDAFQRNPCRARLKYVLDGHMLLQRVPHHGDSSVSPVKIFLPEQTTQSTLARRLWFNPKNESRQIAPARCRVARA